MKAILTSILASSLTLGLLNSCMQSPDDMDTMAMTEVYDALQSPQIAVTPMMPGWLLEPKDIHLLTHDDKMELVNIAEKGRVREIPAEYYDNPDHGKRNKDTRQLFYLYASDAQCLSCRVIKGNRIIIDDLVLSKKDTKNLYSLLFPYVSKMASSMTPEQKTAATAVAAEKAYQRIKDARMRKTFEEAQKAAPQETAQETPADATKEATPDTKKSAADTKTSTPANKPSTADTKPSTTAKPN